MYDMDRTYNQIPMTGKAQRAVKYLATSYEAYQDASNQGNYLSLLVWIPLLHRYQQETGVTLVDAEFLRKRYQTANDIVAQNTRNKVQKAA